MATLRDIKRKISSIGSTQTITRTMKMVSAAKLRRAQEELDRISEYAVRMEQMVGRVVMNMPEDAHPLLTPREEVKNVLIMALASDRGLCGSFNINIGLSVENFVRQNREKYERIGVYVFGRKLKEYLQRRKVNIVGDRSDIRKIDYPLVTDMTEELTGSFVDGEYDRVYLLYTHFQSAVKQIVRFEELIPVSTAREGEYIDYICEPPRDAILETLVPRYIMTKLYYALAESQTSEHAARMSTMENATSNCGEMIRYLTLVYNKRRQESITSEMMDIVGGAEALRGT
jgi:F-type H+-transporting ATPase subunit gamma